MSKKRSIGCGLSAALALALSAYAEPQETVSYNGVISDGLYGAAENTVLNHSFTGSYTATKIRISGTLNALDAFTWPADARIEVTTPGGSSFQIQPFTQTGGFTSVSTPGDVIVNLPVPIVAAGNWTFRFFEDYDDAPGGPEASWDPVTITLDDEAPPPPPPPPTFGETEPNDDKFSANEAFGLVAGNTLGGSAINESDTFKVKTAPAALGVYRHRLELTSDTPGHVGTIRGLSQTGGSINFGTDVAVMTTSTTTTPPRFMQWYGFGKQEELFIRVTGSSTSTAEYRATYSVDPMSVVEAGTFIPGDITIAPGTGNTADLDFMVYDHEFNALPGYSNDGGNILTRNYAEGTYYIAFSIYNTAHDQPAPPDDTFPSENVMDFPSVVVNNSTALVTNMGIRISDVTAAPVETFASKDGPYDVVFFRMVVAPPTGPTNPVVNGAASPAAFFQGGSTLLTGTVTGGFNPPSTGMVVTGDLSSIGGSSTQLFFDDGTNGDVTPGDNIFSFTATAATAGSFTIPLTVTDAQARTGNGSINIQVNSLTNLGALTLPSNTATPSFDLAQGEVRWFRFDIPEVNNANERWLDIWSTGESPFDDTEIGLYDSAGNRIANDDQDGADNFSALSFGLTAPVRPAVGNGTAFNGRDGGLAAGTHYLAIGMWPDTAFGASNFAVTSTGPAAFGLQMVLDLGQLTPTGACCVQGSCSVMSAADCTTAGGTYNGDGTDCGTPSYGMAGTNEQLSSIAGFGNLAGVASGCDDCTETVALPFTFNFFGTDYTSVVISSNGNLQFGNSPSTAYLNDAIPGAAVPNNAVYPLWDDYNPGEQGDIYFVEDGVAPNRRFIVEWNNVTQYTAGNTLPTTSETFQAILHEGSNNVEFRYGSITPVIMTGTGQGTGQDASGGDRTIGIENADGSLAYSTPSASHSGEGQLVTFVAPPSVCGPVCGTADFDGDGDTGTDADIEAFFSCLAGNCCATCWSLGADFNADGDVGTDADIEAFFRVLAGNPC